jgi:tellurite resistance protein TehA-like permease
MSVCDVLYCEMLLHNMIYRNIIYLLFWFHLVCFLSPEVLCTLIEPIIYPQEESLVFMIFMTKIFFMNSFKSK